MCREGKTSKTNCSAQLSAEADVWQGRLSGILFKVLLYDDLVDVVTSRHMKKMTVTLFNPPLPKTPCYTQTSWLL